MLSIVFITTNYKSCTHDKFGYLSKEFDSWFEFLNSEIIYNTPNLSNYISDNKLVFTCIADLKNFDFDKKLLHGDYLYDLLSAIFSNVGIVNKLSLDEILNLVDDPRDKMIDMLVIVLYSRISRCLKYHYGDIGGYMRILDEIVIRYGL